MTNIIEMKYTPVSGINKTLDDGSRYCELDLLRHIHEEHIIRRISESLAKRAYMPPSTVFMAGLGVFSSIAMRKWCVSYPNGDRLPIGIYAVLEQPPATGKSRVIKMFQQKFIDQQVAVIGALAGARDKAKTEDEEDDIDKRLDIASRQLFVTNSTPEALDAVLTENKGFFSAISSEQGLFDSLLGLSYGEKGRANNNDAILNGFDGGNVATRRTSRKAYCGSVVGSVVCFAQPGGIEKVLSASNGTGLAERFIMLSEPHYLGRRDFTRDAEKFGFFGDIEKLFYNNKCHFIDEILEDPKRLSDLIPLRLSSRGWQLIDNYRQEIEPHLADGGKFGHAALRGAAGKVDITILKLASNMHLLYDQDNDLIEDFHVSAAIGIADDLLISSLNLCQSKGISGQKSEFEAILKMFKRKDLITEREILQSRKCVEPFISFTGNRSDLIRENLKEMCNQGLLSSDASGGKREYKLNQ